MRGNFRSTILRRRDRVEVIPILGRLEVGGDLFVNPVKKPDASAVDSFETVVILSSLWILNPRAYATALPVLSTSENDDRELVPTAESIVVKLGSLSCRNWAMVADGSCATFRKPSALSNKVPGNPPPGAPNPAGGNSDQACSGSLPSQRHNRVSR